MSGPVINLLSPNGGENWKFGETRRITWTAEGLDKVAIYVYNDTILGSGSTNYLDPAGTSLSVPASRGYFDWTVTQNWLPTPASGNENRYKIVISGASANGILARDASDNYFSISSKSISQITITSPNGGENWNGNQQNKISWVYSGNVYSQIDILMAGYDVLGNQLGDWKLIAAGVSTSQGYYYWVPSGAPLYWPTGLGNITFAAGTAKYKIKIREANDSVNAITDVSNNYSTIHGATTAPTGVTISAGAFMGTMSQGPMVTVPAGTTLVNLDWTSTNATSCNIVGSPINVGNGNNLSTSDSAGSWFVVDARHNNTYTITCSNAAGSTSNSVTVNIAS